MTPNERSRRRISAQWLVASRSTSIAGTARHLLALQAQDLPASRWALGMRTPGATVADVEAAYRSRAIVRAWPLRGTLHAVAAEDLGWLTRITADRLIAGSVRRATELGLDAKQLAVARDVIDRVLVAPMSRDEIYAAFTRAKLDPSAQRGYHLLWNLATRGVICLAGDAYVRCDTWIAAPRALDPDEALGELARRYFRGHGPATRRDLQRWAKLSAAETARAIAVATRDLASHGEHYFDEASAPAADATLALPGFDELILGYDDRTCTLPAAHAAKIVPGGNGIFKATLVENGVAIGTWSRTVRGPKLALAIELFRARAKPSAAAIAAVERYAAFVELAPSWG